MSQTQSQNALQRSRRIVLGEILARNSRRSPDTPALIFGEETRTFSELNRRVNQLANALTQRGIAHGDSVAVLMYNRLELLESYFACLKLGAVVVPVNFRLTIPEVAYILGNSRAKAVLTDDTLTQTAIEATSENENVRFIATTGNAVATTENYEDMLAEGGATEPDVAVEEDDLAFIMYTSGTTGLPKGAMLNHRNLVANTTNWILELEAREGDVWLSGLPLFHIGGLAGVLPFIYLCSTSVITPSTNFNALESLRMIESYNVTMCYFVPTQWQQICSLEEVRNVDTSRLRKAMWGASQAPISTLELLAETFPSVDIVNAFGQTEMSSNTTFLKGQDSVRKMGSVGLPAINIETRVVDEDGHNVAPGEVGEIIYRGPTVMQGYFDNPAETEQAFRDGWFHSGDLVRQDSEGYLYVVDRIKDMIVSGGENIYPAEVERAVADHEAVAEVAVFGVDHEHWVSTPVAAVVPVAGTQATADDIIAFTKTKVASYKKPTAIFFVDELPRNASGKILKRVLRERYEAGEL